MSAEERALLPLSLIEKHIESDNVLQGAGATGWPTRLGFSFLLGSVGAMRRLTEGGMVRPVGANVGVIQTTLSVLYMEKHE